ncbi:MAG: glycosyltransferase [Alphaproteobacteria bacterium]|nr:glycosyltransferase [Alphaproteobacteria bacterium]
MSEAKDAPRTGSAAFADRQKKLARQLRYGWGHARRVSFVFGCQRSGTTMLMRTLDESPETRIFHENHSVAFDDFRLRSDASLRTLIRLHPAPAQIFKPICDSQDADRILDRFPEARGLWIYRHPDDVANSAVVKWGAHQVEIVDAIARGDLGSWGWRTERLAPDVVEEIRRVHRDDLTPHEGALLFWYLRNRFFFDLGLDRHPRVLLVRYEDLVTDPEPAFQPVFSHLGVPWRDDAVARVRKSSIGRRPSPECDPAIRALCEGLLERLDAALTTPPERPLPSPVLLVTNSMGVGGAERYVVTVANWMVERGAKVTVTAEPGDLAATLDPRVRYQPEQLINLRAGIPRAAVRLAQLIHQEKPRVVVANSLVSSWVVRLAQPWGRAPLVTVAHGWPADRYRSVAPLMRVSDVVVAVSPEVRDQLVAHGLPADRCRVIHNGVDCRPLHPRTGAARAAARRELGVSDDALVVALLGRLSAQKAHQHVISIAAALRGDLPHLRFVLIGGGEREDELRALAAEQGVEDRVLFLGIRADVPELLGAADIYLSTSDWEGMPLSTIEAMASGLPCVATCTEGTSLLVTPECGAVVPVGDVAALTDAVRALAQDPDQRAVQGAAARKRALAHFSHDRMVGDLVEVLRGVVPG